MQIFVLIWVIGAYGSSVTSGTAEFGSRRACVEAAQQIKEQSNNTLRVAVLVCAPKEVK